MCMAVLGIIMFCKFKLNLFNLGPFGGDHDVACRLRIMRMIEYGVLAQNRNM